MVSVVPVKCLGSPLVREDLLNNFGYILFKVSLSVKCDFTGN